MALDQCLLACPDTKPPGWKARFSNGTLLKCAYTLIPMASKISTGQKLTWVRKELASFWPQSTTGMRRSSVASCFTIPSSLPAAFWVPLQSGNSPQKEEGLCLLKQIAPRSLRKVQHLSPPSKMPPPCLQLWTASSISMQVTFLTHKTTSFPRSRLIQPASTGNRQGSRGGAAVESSPSGMQTLLKKRKIFPSHTDF